MTANEISFSATADGQKGLFVPVIGYERTAPNHSFSSVRDYYLFHFVISGKGKYFVDGKTYTLGKNYGFIIEPGVETRYEADAKEPWEYCWIGARGIDVVKLLESSELFNRHWFSFEPEVIQPILSALEDFNSVENLNPDYKKLRVNAAFLEVLSCFVPKVGSGGEIKNERSRSIALGGAEYFEKNFSFNIGVNEAAQEMGVSRVYFSTLFTKEFGVPPKEYLTDVRVGKAKKLLADTDLPLSEIAEKCGFSDVSVFAKNFKKVSGSTPNAYRKNK